MLVSLTVGKVDAGVTVLLTPDKRLIEFPSILLPPNISSGSIVDITVGRNSTAETKAQHDFGDLQERIFDAFGASEPTVPVLRCRNATQTSVVLEWDPVELATAELLSLSLFRNGQKAGNIPKPLSMHSTKISGLAVDTEYTFHLVLRTTAGTYTSEKVAVRTHKLTDLSGITITTGILPHHIKEELDTAVARIGAKIVDGVRIDTTHFITTEGRGIAWEKAVENNIPVVRPEWVEACEKSGRILGVTKFYLDAVRPGPPTPSDPSSSQKDLPAPPPDHSRSQSQSQSQSRSPPQPQAPTQPQPSVQPPPPNGDGASASPAPASTSGDNKQESSDDEEEDKAAEQKTRAPDQDEQKMRLEDKEEQQNLALRPSSTKPESDASDSGKGDEDNPEPPVSSSRASFQNVEL
ncbi:chitin biosynthesis protein CHS5 [Plectosphaerella cucumerina]|uniref:Chitin biosynthesis protein CHS5 n=1 Tax=Plectosphaerella cucumerina TaxID=40658 RepID=A0A8K0X2B2_9PEZI|nr:chitin biosynthesis protein CHS5 [Plectosphaerella cucumerina]